MFKNFLHNALWESIELLIAALCLVSGLGVLLAPAIFAPVVLQNLPTVVLTAWSVCLLLGGVLTGQGIGFSNVYTQRAGFALLAGACLALFGVLAVTGDSTRALGAVTYLLAAVAFWARFLVLGRLHGVLSTAVRVEKAEREQRQRWRIRHAKKPEG